MTLPYGLTLEDVKKICDQYDSISNDVTNGKEPKPQYGETGCPNYTDWHEDDEYIDRYIHTDKAEYCVSTQKYDDDEEVNLHYLSETVLIYSSDGELEHWFISELRELIGR